MKQCALLLIAAASLASCSDADGDRPRPVIRVGLLALMDGLAARTSGEPSIAGAELAAEEINGRGGVVLGGLSHRVVLVVGEYADRPDSATSVARRLINRDHVDVLLGPQFSRHAIPVSLVAENARVPTVSPMSSNPETTRNKRFVFRLASLDSAQASVMAGFALEELGAARAAVLYDISTSYGRSLAEAFQEKFSRGGEIVCVESYTLDDAEDYGEQLERIRAADPDVLFLPSDTKHVAAQIRQARAIGVDAVLLGSDTWDLELLRDVPEASGAYYAHQWHPGLDVAASRSFVASYTERFGAEPTVTAAMTYDGLALLVDAFRRSQSTSPDAVRDALAATDGFQAVTGEIHFGDDGDPERGLVISKLVGGRAELERFASP